MALATAIKGLKTLEWAWDHVKGGGGRNGEGSAILGFVYVHLQFILSPVWELTLALSLHVPFICGRLRTVITLHDAAELGNLCCLGWDF